MLVLCSCQLSVQPNNAESDKKLAEREIVKFHNRFNSGDFGTIWDEAATGLQQVATKRDFVEFLNNGHSECGDFKGVIDKRINVIIGSPIQVRVVYNSQFDKAVLTEIFAFIKTDGKIFLSEYKVARGPSKLPDTGR